MTPCETCAGSGRLLRRTTLIYRGIRCPDCDGDGQVPDADDEPTTEENA